jgi:hypothetical protein
LYFLMLVNMFDPSIGLNAAGKAREYQLSVNGLSSNRHCAMLHCSMIERTQGCHEAAVPAPIDPLEDDRRSAPPQVYYAPDEDHWIVEPPSGEGTMVFTGSNAQLDALTYAHEKFGSARFFPY